MAGWRLFLFSLLLPVTVTASTAETTTVAPKPKCHELPRGRLLVTSVDVCTVDESKDFLGNRDEPVILDFSHADQATLNGFLGQKKSKSGNYIFKTVYGAIILDSNPNVTELNFFEIDKLESDRLPENSTFINISNNPKLKKITLEQNARIIEPRTTRNIFIYNNPLLETQTITDLQKFNHTKNIQAYFQSKSKECQFTHPFDHTKDTRPTAKFLKNCETLRGDFILEGGAPQGKIQLDDEQPACLRLIGVNLANYEINLPVPLAVNPILTNSATKTASPNTTEPPSLEIKGLARCKNGKKSEIRGNRGLCKEKMMKLVEYYENLSAVHIEVDKSCADACQNLSDVHNSYYLCHTIEGDFDLGSWFTQPELAKKPEILKNSLGILKIMNSTATKIEFPALSEANEIYIDGNDNLVDLKLPNLTTVKFLAITNNPQLSFNVIKNLPKFTVEKFAVECVTDLDTVITNLEDLSLCTAINGPLILEGIIEENIPDSTLQQITVIEGCITVRNTRLTNLKFLENLASNCQENHELEDNPNLCQITSLNGVAVEVNEKMRFKKRCGPSCKNTVTAGCVKAYGDIKITDKTDLSNLEDLEYIEGSLTISDTELSHLNFPKLNEITGNKGPLLRITNNRHLTSIKMPLLEIIQLSGAGTGRLLEITGNSQLENLKSFLPEQLRRKCTAGGDGECLYDGRDRAKPQSWTRFAIITGILATIYLILLAGCLYLCLSQIIREGREVEETRRFVAEKIANPRKDYTCPGMPGGPYWQHLLKGGDAGSQKSEQPSYYAKKSTRKMESTKKMESTRKSEAKSGRKVEKVEKSTTKVEKIDPKAILKPPPSDKPPKTSPATAPVAKIAPPAPPTEKVPDPKGKKKSTRDAKK